MIFILGQAIVLHSFDSSDSPSSVQFFPPFAGLGFEHVLIRVCVPPSQNAEQWPHGSHSE